VPAQTAFFPGAAETESDGSRPMTHAYRWAVMGLYKLGFGRAFLYVIYLCMLCRKLWISALFVKQEQIILYL
jgi:hypothetical protein